MKVLMKLVGPVIGVVLLMCMWTLTAFSAMRVRSVETGIISPADICSGDCNTTSNTCKANQCVCVSSPGGTSGKCQ